MDRGERNRILRMEGTNLMLGIDSGGGACDARYVGQVKGRVVVSAEGGEGGSCAPNVGEGYGDPGGIWLFKVGVSCAPS